MKQLISLLMLIPLLATAEDFVKMGNMTMGSATAGTNTVVQGNLSVASGAYIEQGLSVSNGDVNITGTYKTNGVALALGGGGSQTNVIGVPYATTAGIASNLTSTTSNLFTWIDCNTNWPDVIESDLNHDSKYYTNSLPARIPAGVTAVRIRINVQGDAASKGFFIGSLWGKAEDAVLYTMAAGVWNGQQVVVGITNNQYRYYSELTGVNASTRWCRFLVVAYTYGTHREP